MRSLRTLARSIIVAGFANACQRSAEPSRAVEVLVGTEPATLDPRFATRGLDVKLTRLVHAGLVTLDPESLEPRPYLARSLTRRNQFDIDVELVATARFHSGKPLRAGDVCATIEAVRDPRMQSPHRSILEAFSSCHPTGPLSLTITLSGPRGSWMSDLEIPILRADQVRSAPEFDGSLDGLGPFSIASHAAGIIELTPANNGKTRQARYPISVRTVHDENARAMRLLSGRAELAPNAFSPSLLSGFERKGTDVVVSSRPGSNVTYLLTRCDRPPFDRPSVRHGVSLAIDRDVIVNSLLAGKARAAKWLIPQGHWAAPQHLPKLEYDPVRARAQLSNLGSVALLTSTDRSRVLLARAVAQMLTDAGLATQVVPLELGLLLARLDAGQFTLAILQIPELTEPNILSWFFHPRGISGGSGEGKLLGKNRTRYGSSIAGQLLDQASASFDPEERRKLYVELADVMLSDMPVIPLWHEDQIVVARERGKRFVPSAEGRWLALADL